MLELVIVAVEVSLAVMVRLVPPLVLVIVVPPAVEESAIFATRADVDRLKPLTVIVFEELFASTLYLPLAERMLLSFNPLPERTSVVTAVTYGTMSIQ